MPKIRTGNDLVSEQTRKLIRRGCCGVSGGKWEREIDGNSPQKLLTGKIQDVMCLFDWLKKMIKLSMSTV